LIDASILISYERRKVDLRSQLVARAVKDLRISVITASEILHGVARANDPGIRQQRAAIVERLLTEFPIVLIDLETARIHAQLWADLQAAGNMIGPHDLWLAATCLQHGMTMVTANETEFRRVPGLAVENWLAP
jgi:predicted nucleic acid-binding protein